MKKQGIFLEAISCLFIVLFMYAALSKMLAYDKFKLQVGQSPLLTGFGGFVPWAIISIEIVVSVMLVMDRLRLIAFFACFGLMTMFTAYIIAILNFATFIPCSCGGVLEKLTWNEHLIFNGVFIFLALVGIVLLASIETKQDYDIFEAR